MNVNDLMVRLRNARPAKLRVVLNDETEQRVAMPRGRNRFERASTIIDAMPWATVYPLDAQGNVCDPPIHREDTAPAGDLEDLAKDKNPTVAVVHGVMAAMAPVIREVHKVATQSSVELVTKVRSVHREEMKDVIEGYGALVEKTFDRMVGFEERSNELMQENDALRAELAELRQQGSNSEHTRDAMLAKVLGVDLGDEKPPGGQPDGGKNGNGAR